MQWRLPGADESKSGAEAAMASSSAKSGIKKGKKCEKGARGKEWAEEQRGLLMFATGFPVTFLSRLWM